MIQIPGIWLTTNCILNNEVNNQIFLAEVANMPFLALPDLKTSTTALLSHLISIYLSCKYSPQILRRTTIFQISKCTIV